MLWIVLDVDDLRLFKNHSTAVHFALLRGFDEDFPVEIDIEDDGDDTDNDSSDCESDLDDKE